MTSQQYLEASARSEKRFPDNVVMSPGILLLLESIVSTNDTWCEIKRMLIYNKTPDEYFAQLMNVPNPVLVSGPDMELLHMALGMVTEAGEFMEFVLNRIAKQVPLEEDMRKELGDLQWYVAGAIRKLGTTFEEVHDENIAKLKMRYPDEFSEEAALARADEA